MSKLVYYLYETNKVELTTLGLWPKYRVEEIVYLLEWYSTKLRPFMWEFYGIMTAASQAGLTNHGLQNNESFDDVSMDLQKLQ